MGRFDKNEIIVENSVIKGFHVYRVPPPLMDPPVRLKVDREYSNMKDKDVSLVWVPDIDSFEEADKSFIVDE